MYEIKTEHDWETAPDVQTLLDYYAPHLTEREARQFVLSCVASITQTFPRYEFEYFHEWIHSLLNLMDGRPNQNLANLLTRLYPNEFNLQNAVHISLFSPERLDDYVNRDRVKQLNPNLLVYAPKALESFNYLIYTTISLADVALEFFTRRTSIAGESQVRHTDELLRSYHWEYAQIFRAIVGNPFREDRQKVRKVAQSLKLDKPLEQFFLFPRFWRLESPWFAWFNSDLNDLFRVLQCSIFERFKDYDPRLYRNLFDPYLMVTGGGWVVNALHESTS